MPIYTAAVYPILINCCELMDYCLLALVVVNCIVLRYIEAIS